MTATILAPADLWTCAECGEDKPRIEFGARKNNQGRTYHYKTCRTCMATAERTNPARRARKTAIQKAARAAERASWSVSGEITALIRATTVPCKGPKAPLPTREDMRRWYHGEGCRL